MKTLEFRLLNWILSASGGVKHNLSLSGMKEPNLNQMGINTNFEDFVNEPDVHEKLLTETIARMHGVDPENVVITAGGSEAIFIAYSVFGNGGKAVVPLPNYEPIFAVPKSLGMKVSNSLRNGMVEEGSIVGMTNPNNPTGKYVDDESIQRLVRNVKKRNGYIFVNETYRDFKFEPPTRYSVEETNNLIVCSSLTKFYGLGRLRIGWLIAERSNAMRLRRAKQLISGHSSEYSMWIARQVLKNRETFVIRTKELYKENIDLVRGFLEATHGILAILPDAAPFCLVRYKNQQDSESLSRELLKEKGVLVSPGDYFGAPRSFRLCFTADKDDLASGLAELSDFLNQKYRE
ncbi:MAG: pyridoxal phosphate-dependent aminotransferase [Nitrososphaerota archaeon]|nr:pyridoxal phosphate-dependent aminotransferase [Nitrososphaerota archaeon]